jgi:glycyl-tRNA synthetase beta chain
MGLSDNARAHAMRAALLAKADLVTATVVEHPILHGFMGGVYAELSGEPDPVVAAIAAHECAPPADELPADPVTRVVALADKLDALVACFAANLIPTPAADPYALHDAAVIVGRLLDEGGGEDILECVIADAADGMIDNPDDLVTRVAGFVRRAYGHHKPEHDSPHG